MADALAPLGEPDILLSNWGEIEQLSDESPLLGSPVEDLWPMPRLARMHRLVVNAGISGGELGLAFRFSKNLHDRASIERLADLVARALRSFLRAEDS